MSVASGMDSGTPGAPHVLVAGSVESLGRIVAQRAVDALAFRLKDEWVSAAHVVISGGIITDAVLTWLADSYAKHRVDWTKVHVWWSDERYLPEGSVGRFETRARAAGLARIGIPETHLHAVGAPARTDEEAPDEAAVTYARLLRKYAPHGRPTPIFDLVLLELGADGTVGGLFPGHDAPGSADPVIPLWQAPPPSRMRVAMTMPTLTATARMWLLGMGADRVQAVRDALTAAPDAADAPPAARARGIIETLWWLDQHAAKGVPGGHGAALAEPDPAPAEPDADGAPSA